MNTGISPAEYEWCGIDFWLTRQEWMRDAIEPEDIENMPADREAEQAVCSRCGRYNCEENET